MTGFHIIIYTATTDEYILSDSANFPVQAINRWFGWNFIA